MTKEELEVKIESLKTMITEGQQQTSNYAGQLDTLNKQLKDINKIALPPAVFDEIVDAIESGINDFDFNDSNNYDTEFSLDYDNKVQLDSLYINNSNELGEMIMDRISEIFTEMDAPEDDQVNNVTEVKKVHALFVEAECPEDELDTTEDDNHPVENLQG